MVLELKITHNIAPVNLHSSINVTSVSQCSNVCLILTDLDIARSTYF